MIVATYNIRNIEVQEKNTTFDPFSDLFLRQKAKPAHLTEIDVQTLTPFQRALLVNDGTVTKFLEAYTLESIEISLLKQETQKLLTDQPWLEVPKETSVIVREVLLRGALSTKVYAYANSLLLPERLPQDVRSKLQVEKGGLGRILLNSLIEERREVLWYGHEHIADLSSEIEPLTGKDFLSRTYRIIVGGKPIMLITEKFPFHLQ
jgi:chorismate-pyruvate lyase